MAISVANLRFPIRIGLLRKYKEPAPSETENENEGLAPDYSRAMNWFELAASKGSGETTHLGVLRDASTSTTWPGGSGRRRPDRLRRPQTRTRTILKHLRMRT